MPLHRFGKKETCKEIPESTGLDRPGKLCCILSCIDATDAKGSGGIDQELIAYLDKRFRETAEQISDQIGSLRQDTTRQIAGLEGQIAGLREETTQRFEQVDRRFEQAEERDRQILVVTEGIRHEVHLV